MLSRSQGSYLSKILFEIQKSSFKKMQHRICKIADILYQQNVLNEHRVYLKH